MENVFQHWVFPAESTNKPTQCVANEKMWTSEKFPTRIFTFLLPDSYKNIA